MTRDICSTSGSVSWFSILVIILVIMGHLSHHEASGPNLKKHLGVMQLFLYHKTIDNMSSKSIEASMRRCYFLTSSRLVISMHSRMKALLQLNFSRSNSLFLSSELPKPVCLIDLLSHASQYEAGIRWPYTSEPCQMIFCGL